MQYIISEQEMKELELLRERKKRVIDANIKWQKTDHGKIMKSFNQRIYIAKRKNNWERVNLLENEKRIYLEGRTNG